jgi:ribosomal protein L12E/L44/L45/RPP1/RPP2
MVLVFLLLSQVIDEIVGDTLAAMPAARRAQPQAARATAQQQEEDEEQEGGEMAELHQRLEAAKT